MNSKEADSNDSEKDLLSVLKKRQYSVLESVLSIDLFPDGIPRLEEASEVIQNIYYELLVGPNSAYYVDESSLEAFANNFGLTCNQIEKCLVRDIERFGLHGVLGLNDYDAAVYAFAGILSRFSIEGMM